MFIGAGAGSGLAARPAPGFEGGCAQVVEAGLTDRSGLVRVAGCAQVVRAATCARTGDGPVQAHASSMQAHSLTTVTAIRTIPPPAPLDR